MLSSKLKFTSNSKALLTLVGVGPGDSSLMTLEAVKSIQEASIVAFPVSQLGGVSMAANIASSWISEEKKKMPLFFPMISDIEPRKKAWREASEQLVTEVAKGEKVVFLCQGDPSLFASSSYLLLAIRSNYPQCPIKIVPGINSYSAAAAAAYLPLALQQEQLLILPTPDDPKILESLLKEAAFLGRVIVLLKVGKRWSWVKDILKKMNLLEKAMFIQKIGFNDQKIMKSSEVSEDESPYFSLLIVRQSLPEIIP